MAEPDASLHLRFTLLNYASAQTGWVAQYALAIDNRLVVDSAGPHPRTFRDPVDARAWIRETYPSASVEW